MLLELLFTFFGFILLWDYLVRKRKNDVIGDMPGPPALPLLGNALMYRGQTPEEIMEFIMSNSRKYGKLYRVWLLQKLAVFSCDPRDIEVVLSSTQHITKNHLYDLLHCWLGTGLLMSTGTKWHTRRRIITPTFHFNILRQFVDIFHSQSRVLVQQLEKHADGKTPFNVYPYVCLAALDIIAETAMGTKINAQENPQFPYVQAVTNVTNIMAKRFINIWMRKDWLFRLAMPALARSQHESIKLMHNFTDEIIRKRRDALHEAHKATRLDGQSAPNLMDMDVDMDMVDSELGPKAQRKRMALLDVLLQASVDGKPLSDTDIREEVDTFMFEGHDTTTSATSFCLYMIATHAAVQSKLHAELCAVLGDCRQDSAITYDQLNSLKYLECVIKESLRMWPPVPMIGRYFGEEVVIRDIRIPAHTNYTVGIFVVLRDPDIFPEPNRFDPDRFLNERTENAERTNPFAYIPFSAGPRNCIGKKFAMLEMKMLISMLLRHYELLPSGIPLRPLMNIVLRSANGMHIVLRPRGAPEEHLSSSSSTSF